MNSVSGSGIKPALLVVLVIAAGIGVLSAGPALAGVFTSGPVSSAIIPVDNDNSQDRYTGFAVANTSGVDLSLRLTIFSADGAEFDQLRLSPPVPAYGQMAAFLHQYLGSVLKFRGTLRVSAENGQQFAIVALQQSKGLLTAIPVIPAN